MKKTENNKGNVRMAKVTWYHSAPRGIEITTSILLSFRIGYINLVYPSTSSISLSNTHARFCFSSVSRPYYIFPCSGFRQQA